MFNGIIYNTGRVNSLKKNNDSIYVGIKTNLSFKKKDVGSSICCDGVCLTITKILKKEIFFKNNKPKLKILSDLYTLAEKRFKIKSSPYSL